MPYTVPEEDIDLFAEGLYRARGKAARGLALSRAKGLRSIGDEEGHLVWKAVADRIVHIAPRIARRDAQGDAQGEAQGEAQGDAPPMDPTNEPGQSAR